MKRIKDMSDKQQSIAGGTDTSMKTILIVEDDQDIGEFIAQTLQLETSYQTLLATNGAEALEQVKSIKPNIFLLDYMLPGINGIELYDQLHAITGFEHIPAIMMSANLPTQAAHKRKIACLKKPFELDELLQCIEQLIA